MEQSNYGRSAEVPKAEFNTIHNLPPVIPPRVLAVIKRHAALGGWPLEVFLNRRPFHLKGGRHRMCHSRWECWAELREMRRADGSRFSFPLIGQWFGMDHSTIMHGVDPERRARALEKMIEGRRISRLTGTGNRLTLVSDQGV